MVVLFDFDEVFVGLNTGALKFINEALGTSYQMKDVKSWDFYDAPLIREQFMKFLELPDLYQRHVQVHKKMIQVLKTMVEQGKEVYIITASVEPSERSKYQFIKEQMPFFDRSRLFTVNSSSKYKQKSDVLDELHLNYHEPIVLIDDGIHNILDMMADSKHRARLDGLMRDFYAKRTLNKFDNPYHEFIYGIVPELPYNELLSDGKRIFKMKETKEIWGILDKIKGQHRLRVSAKQSEVFNFLNNVVNDLLPDNVFKAANELQNNVSFLAKQVLSGNNAHTDFLSQIARFTVKVEEILKAQGVNLLGEKKNPELAKVVLDMIFRAADQRYGADVMYNEIKDLVLLHVDANLFPENAKRGRLISEQYGIADRQMDFFTNSIIGSLIEIAKENMLCAKELVKVSHSERGQELLKKLLLSAGMDYQMDWEDTSAIHANALLAFNKNYKFNQNGSLEAQDMVVGEVKAALLLKEELPVKTTKAFSR